MLKINVNIILLTYIFCTFNSFLNVKINLKIIKILLLGNEEADLLTCSAAHNGVEFSIMPNYAEVLYKFKIKCWENWKEYFDLKSKEKGIWYKTMQSEPPRIPWFTNMGLGRQLIIVAVRLRSGHIPLNSFAYLMKKVLSPNCSTCDRPEDVQHLLLECARNRKERDALMEKLKVNQFDVGAFQTILSDPHSEQAMSIYTFINASLKDRNRFRLDRLDKNRF